MKVYLVIEEEYYNQKVVAVFSQKEYAQKHIKLNNKNWIWDVVEWDVDEHNYVGVEIVEKLHYKVAVYEINGQFVTIEDTYEDLEKYSQTDIPEDKTIIYAKPITRGDLLEVGFVEVWVDNVSEAKRTITKRIDDIKMYKSQLNKGI